MEMALRHLADEDDPALWLTAIDQVYTDAAYLCAGNVSGKFVATHLGACSHWLRPHQTRWTADGGFAWPTGYGGAPSSRAGMPQHDWHVSLWWSEESGRWQADPPRRWANRASLLFRVSIPTRTARHQQAAIHTIWSPGTPPRPTEPAVQFYGFRRRASGWTCTATSGSVEDYELVANRDPGEG